MKDQIKRLAEKYHEKIVGFRRHFHMHPELSFEEFKTSEYVVNFLRENGIVHRSGLGGGTGIIAELGSGNSVLALRADMDALPITETSEISYKSQNEGCMHACGHDVHTSSLMGSLLILKELEAHLTNKVRFIFQPGEERLPGGALDMIKDGALSGVKSILGQHVHPDLPSGKIGYCPGYFMASADELFITVIGKGGHGARPQEVIDTVLVSSEIITSLQTIVSRSSDPIVPSVLTIGKIYSEGGATNIIPDKVHLEGTFRTFDEKWRKRAHDLIKNKIHHIAASFGASAEVNIKIGYPSLLNDPGLTNATRKRIAEYMGEENVKELAPRMTSEDFAFYSHEVPACFYRLGTASGDGTKSSPVHTSTFDIDEEALLHGSGLMAYLAMTS